MKILYSILAILFPWAALLLYDNPGGAIVALGMQATIIGWIPASIWAWKVVHANPNKETNEQETPKT